MKHSIRNIKFMHNMLRKHSGRIGKIQEQSEQNRRTKDANPLSANDWVLIGDSAHCSELLHTDQIRLRTIVSMTKAPANHFVARASRASSDLALFFDIKVSELPPNAPESPDVLPDCIVIIAMIATQMTRCIIVKASFIRFQSSHCASRSIDFL